MSQPRIRQIAHLCILSADLARSAAFYESAFGARRAFDFKRGAEWIGFYLDLGNRTFIEVFATEDARTGGMGRIDHLCLETDGLEALCAHMAAQGIRVTPPKLGPDGTWQAWTEDPDGTRLELFQYTAESQQFVGGVCQVDW